MVAPLLALLLLASATPAHAQRADDDPACTPLTPRQLVGQVLGTAVGHPDPDAAGARTTVGEGLGTVVLLGGAVTSAEQVRALTATLRDAAPAGLLVAVDEEGGRVARFGRAGLVPHLPSARAMAATMTPDQVRGAAAELARQLAGLGVDWDLAPVLDLSADPATTVIGDRSFSADPAVAGAHATAFAAGLRDGGLLTAGKHFPDHGLTTIDSHTARPVVDVDPDRLVDHHLAPYRQAAAHLDAVMLSHLLVPALDPHRVVSQSPAAIALLRDELGHDGLVVTDDLSMQAVAADTPQPEAALRALQAGADLALVGDLGVVPAAADRLLAAWRDGTLPADRLLEAARRVLTAKGHPPAHTTCLLGLRPVADARVARDGAGRTWWIEDGTRRLVPDRATLAGLGRRVVHRYSDAELATLPEGPPLPSSQRVRIHHVAGPADDPAVIALARARQSHGDGTAQRVVITAPDLAVVAAALAGPDVPLLLAHPESPRTARRLLAPDGEALLVGQVDPGELAGDPRVTHLDASTPAATAAQVARAVAARRGPPPEVVVSTVGPAGSAALAPWLAATGRVLLLATPGEVPAVTSEVLAELDAPVLTAGPGATQTLAADGHLGDSGGAIAVAVAARTWHAPGGLVAYDEARWAHVAAAVPLAAATSAVALPVAAGRLAPAADAFVAAQGLPRGAGVPLYLAGVGEQDLPLTGVRVQYHRPTS